MKFLIMLKQSATDTLKTALKRAIRRTTETTGVLIGNKIVDAVNKFYDYEITSLKKFTTK